MLSIRVNCGGLILPAKLDEELRTDSVTTQAIFANSLAPQVKRDLLQTLVNT